MYSLREIAERLRAPESTVRLYRDEFEEFLPARGEGRRRRYEEGAFDALERILTWKKAGWSGGRIRDELKKRTRPEAQARKRTTEERLDEALELLRAQSAELALLRGEVARLARALGEEPLPWDEALRAGESG